MKKEYTINKYEDIMGLPHHISSKHPQMSRENRAAQFAPFAALTGYEDAIDEIARLTEERIELDENSKQELDERLQEMMQHMTDEPEVKVTYFREDEKKEGGSYQDVMVHVKRIDPVRRILLTREMLIIKIDDIIHIE